MDKERIQNGKMTRPDAKYPEPERIRDRREASQFDVERVGEVRL